MSFWAQENWSPRVQKAIMAMKIPSSLSKIAPASKGFIQNSVTGIGAAGLLQTVDNFVGAPMQRFGIVIPFLGIRVSIIDFINYTIHAKGMTIPNLCMGAPTKL